MRAGSKWNPRFFLVTALFLISISPSFCELLASSHAPRNLGEKYLESRHRLAKDVVRNPVIFVPGFAGSGIEVSLKDFKSHWYCGRNSPFFPLWLNIPDALFAKACLFEELTAIYDRKSGNWSNAAGVILRPKDWGGLGGVDFLSTVLGLHVDKTSVFSHVIAALKQLGFSDKRELRGAPYDFRLTADMVDVDRDWHAFVELIEDTYECNGNQSVFLVTHSMGGMKMAFMLSQMTPGWKEKYVAGMVALSGPWWGAPKGMRVLLSGDDFGISFHDWELLPRLKVREKVRKYGGAIWMAPDPKFWGDELLIFSPSGNFSSANFDQLLKQIDLDTLAIRQRVLQHSISEMGPPGVPMWCMYGTGVDTESKFHYGPSWDNMPSFEFESGDGTVPEVCDGARQYMSNKKLSHEYSFLTVSTAQRSLSYCAAFARDQQQPVVVRAWPKRDHVGILTDTEVVNAVLDVLTTKH